MIADYQTDKAEHLQDSASYHQPMRKLHLGEYLNLATSDRSSLWFRPIYLICRKADGGRKGQLGRSCISKGLEQHLSPPIAFDLIEHGEIEHWPQGTALRQHDCIALAAEAGIDNTNRGREILPDSPGQKRFVMNEGIDRAAAQCR